MARKTRKSKLPPLGDVPITLPPRRTATGATVHYTAATSEPCVICTLPSYTRIDDIPLHSDRCLDYYRKAG